MVYFMHRQNDCILFVPSQLADQLLTRYSAFIV